MHCDKDAFDSEDARIFDDCYDQYVKQQLRELTKYDVDEENCNYLTVANVVFPNIERYDDYQLKLEKLNIHSIQYSNCVFQKFEYQLDDCKDDIFFYDCLFLNTLSIYGNNASIATVHFEKCKLINGANFYKICYEKNSYILFKEMTLSSDVKFINTDINALQFKSTNFIESKIYQPYFDKINGRVILDIEDELGFPVLENAVYSYKIYRKWALNNDLHEFADGFHASELEIKLKILIIESLDLDEKRLHDFKYFCYIFPYLAINKSELVNIFQWLKGGPLIFLRQYFSKFFDRFFLWIYKFTSDYSTSPTRAFVIFLLIQMFLICVNWLLSPLNLLDAILNGSRSAIFADSIEVENSLQSIFTLISRLTSIVMIPLFIFSLRKKYR